MEISSRRTTKRPIEPVDEWLQNEGYYRKHAPKDPTCLFRAISEQVYHNQRSHIKVRKECVEFMRENRKLFEEKIPIPYEHYLDQMSCFTEWGSEREIIAISKLYKKNVIIFHGQKLTKDTYINGEYKGSFNLCFTPPKQYETVYTQEHTSRAGFCQALVYQTLYKNVFKMSNVDTTIHKMLHERNNHLRHDKFFLKGNMEMRPQLEQELNKKTEDRDDCEVSQLLSKGITPFPYRIAKALDPNIYRNVDFDIWHEIRREVRNSGFTKFNSCELQTGAKCLVQVDLIDADKVNNNFLPGQENFENNTQVQVKQKRSEPLFYTGHIQEMNKNQGPVVVFIEELGENSTVPFEALKPFPQKKPKQNNWTTAANKKNMIPQSSKWKKPWNSPGRKMKDQISNDTNLIKNQMNNTKTNTKIIMSKPEWSTETTPLDSQSVKISDNFTNCREFSVNASVENARTVLENTHIPSAEIAEQKNVDRKNKCLGVQSDSNEDQSKKPAVTNFIHDASPLNKQNVQFAEKNEIFYPPYTGNSYPHNPHFPVDTKVVNFEVMKNVDIHGNEVPYSDPAAVRHFFNLGVKYFWSQNMWGNGQNGQPFPDGSYYISQPPPDPNMSSNMMNGPIPEGINGNHINNAPNLNRHNNRSSPPRYKEQENINNSRPAGQKMNYRAPEYRNTSTSSRDLHQYTNPDMNRNRIDCKNMNLTDQQTFHKEMPRGNKTNNMAPRFKRNFEGNRNNRNGPQQHYNGQQQHYSSQQQQQQYRQPQQDFDPRTNKKPTGPPQTPTNRGENNDASQIQKQQQNNVPQHQHQQQQQPMLQAQTPPPVNTSFPYPIPYNQIPFVPFSPYPMDPDVFPGHFYPAPTGYVQVPYLSPISAGDLTPENSSISSGNLPPPPPIYQAMEAPSAFPPAQYTGMYSQYMYQPQLAPPQPPMYSPNQPLPPPPENMYTPPQPYAPYFMTYPPPPAPVAAGAPQNSTPSLH